MNREEAKRLLDEISQELQCSLSRLSSDVN